MEPRQFSPSRVARKTVGRENGATSLEDNLTIPGRAENAHTPCVTHSPHSWGLTSSHTCTGRHVQEGSLKHCL